MKAALGTVEVVRKVPSRQIVQVVIELPVEHYKAAVNLLDGQRVLVTVSNLAVPFGVIDSEEDKPEVAEESPAKKVSTLGPIAQWLVMRCKEESFHRWICDSHQASIFSEEEAKTWVCNKLHVESRKDVDGDEQATNRYHASIRLPYAEWLRVNPEWRKDDSVR